MPRYTPKYNGSLHFLFWFPWGDTKLFCGRPDIVLVAEKQKKKVVTYIFSSLFHSQILSNRIFSLDFLFLLPIHNILVQRILWTNNNKINMKWMSFVRWMCLAWFSCVASVNWMKYLYFKSINISLKLRQLKAIMFHKLIIFFFFFWILETISEGCWFITVWNN